jgi:hypothetical protein
VGILDGAESIICEDFSVGHRVWALDRVVAYAWYRVDWCLERAAWQLVAERIHR